MLDCIIVGSGLAGISAALTLQANGNSFQLFGSDLLSNKIFKAEKIHNYPGLSDISGEEFVNLLKAQLKDAGITVLTQKVAGVYAMKSHFVVMTQSGETFESRTVILASGVDNVKEIDGETEFLGRGVSYCATCDGFLYKGKTIAVLCTSKELEHEITYLANFAKKVYAIPLYKNPQITAQNVEMIIKKPIAIEGGLKVEKVVFSRLETAELKEISVDGMFILKESVSPAALVAGLETENGHVKIGRDCSTNLKGCFAAGDCTGRPYQYTKAAGEGNVAAHSVSAYLAEQK